MMQIAAGVTRVALPARAAPEARSTRSSRSPPSCTSHSAAVARRSQSGVASTSSAARGGSLSRRIDIRVFSSPWKAVTSPEGTQYYWNTETNETAWQLPQSTPAASAAAPPASAEPAAAESPAAAASAAPSVGFRELEKILIDVSGVYLAKEAEPYRDVAFSDGFTDYLTAEIAAAQGAGDADRQLKLDKLRTRLANPLIRQPPPF